jgi:O-antigen/teichoic acid export membrane protein
VPEPRQPAKDGTQTSRWSGLVSFDAIPLIARGPNAITLATTIASQGLLVVSGIIVARALGVEGRGTLALLWLVPLSIVLLGGIGIPQATTYYVAREKTNPAAVIWKSIMLTTTIAAFLVLAYGIGLFLIGDVGGAFSSTDALLSIALILPFLGLNLGIAVLLGMKRFAAFNLSRFTAPFLYALSTAVLLAVGDATLTAVLTASLASFAAGAVMAWVLVLRRVRPGGGAADTDTRSIAGFGLRGVVGSTSTITDVRADQLLVGTLMDTRALGIYVAAIAFSNLPRFVAQSIGSVAFPRIASAEGEQARWAATIRAAKIGILAIALFVAALLVSLPVLVPLLFGDEFDEAVGVGRILLVGAFFLSTHRLLTELARGLGHPGYGSITEVVNGLVFVVGVLVFATPASENGIALAVLAGGIASTALLGSLLIRLRRLSPDEEGHGR